MLSRIHTEDSARRAQAGHIFGAGLIHHHHPWVASAPPVSSMCQTLSPGSSVAWSFWHGVIAPVWVC